MLEHERPVGGNLRYNPRQSHIFAVLAHRPDTSMSRAICLNGWSLVRAGEKSNEGQAKLVLTHFSPSEAAQEPPSLDHDGPTSGEL